MTDDEIRALVDDAALRSEVPAVEQAEAFLERLERAETMHVMTTITPELALRQAREVDVRRRRGERLPLDGMAIVLKDNIDVAGVPTTVGSRLFADRRPTEDAEVTRRLREAGAVILGKANMHELAFGATSANEAFGAVVNPAAPDRVPGGSSGGSGAAVAADLCLAAIGTDTGGSVRLPASLCGVSGIRPTYGAVSNRGVQPVSASLDTVGPLARAVTDVHAVLAVLTRFARADDGFGELKGLRVGVVEALVDAAEPGVASCVRTFVEVLEERDASLSTVDLPGWENAVDACSRLIRGEALAVYREALATRPELLEEGTRRRLSRAAELGEAELEALRHARARWDEELERRFGALDVLLTPTIPVEAPLADGADTVATTEAVVPYTFVFAFAHVPALSLPCGTSAGGAPVGVQLAAARGRDGGVLGAGAAVQAATDWHRRRAAHPT
ncbi:MAG TPA: amidase [Gaiella sp.]|jgi:aspartyl-tRNA(Asn)/glutamyl-tRNA(Gln) amidotransferase subunit A|nr:amidase [Gaiella sp.]